MYTNIVLLRNKPMALHISYSKARQNLAKILDEVTKNRGRSSSRDGAGKAS